MLVLMLRVMVLVLVYYAGTDCCSGNSGSCNGSKIVQMIAVIV